MPCVHTDPQEQQQPAASSSSSSQQQQQQQQQEEEEKGGRIYNLVVAKVSPQSRGYREEEGWGFGKGLGLGVLLESAWVCGVGVGECVGVEG